VPFFNENASENFHELFMLAKYYEVLPRYLSVPTDIVRPPEKQISAAAERPARRYASRLSRRDTTAFSGTCDCQPAWHGAVNISTINEAK